MEVLLQVNREAAKQYYTRGKPRAKAHLKVKGCKPVQALRHLRSRYVGQEPAQVGFCASLN